MHKWRFKLRMVLILCLRNGYLYGNYSSSRNNILVFLSKHGQDDYKKNVFKVRTIVNSVKITIKLIAFLGSLTTILTSISMMMIVWVRTVYVTDNRPLEMHYCEIQAYKTIRFACYSRMYAWHSGGHKKILMMFNRS